MKISVLGAGSFGATLAQTLIDANNNDVTLWSHSQEEIDYIKTHHHNQFIKDCILDEKIKLTADLKDTIEAEMFVFVVPSFAVKAVAEQLKSVITNNNQYFVMATKGIDINTLKSGYEIVQEVFPNTERIIILSGPTHAEELALKKFTTIVATATNIADAQLVQKTFHNEYLRVYTNTDTRGVEIVGAAKNVLAIGAGICDSHPKLGDNSKAALLTRGLVELHAISDYYGCNTNTFYGLTGLGDVIVTATSIHSRNRKFGEFLGKGMSVEEAEREVKATVEGIYAAKALHNLQIESDVKLNLIDAIYEIIYEGTSIDNLLLSLKNRPLKSEELDA